MVVTYVLAGLAVVFLGMATLRATGRTGWSHPQVKAWLLLGVIFGAVSAWLFYGQ
jgi:hypothetical protein